jgi:hypothetical protein
MQDQHPRSFSQKDAARRNAEKHFSGPQQTGSSVTQQASAAASDANTARLRALRLEKEEAERAAGTALSPTGKPAAP